MTLVTLDEPQYAPRVRKVAQLLKLVAFAGLLAIGLLISRLLLELGCDDDLLLSHSLELRSAWVLIHRAIYEELRGHPLAESGALGACPGRLIVLLLSRLVCVVVGQNLDALIGSEELFVDRIIHHEML